ncbi:MAG: hypothetical protein M5U20_06755 [Phycisphaerales bacterium]|nr:hypothetical protein [Phycisphaerales bacterium]
MRSGSDHPARTSTPFGNPVVPCPPAAPATSDAVLRGKKPHFGLWKASRQLLTFEHELLIFEPELLRFEPELLIFEPELLRFEPELLIFEPELLRFEPELLIFEHELLGRRAELLITAPGRLGWRPGNPAFAR